MINYCPVVYFPSVDADSDEDSDETETSNTDLDCHQCAPGSDNCVCTIIDEEERCFCYAGYEGDGEVCTGT